MRMPLPNGLTKTFILVGVFHCAFCYSRAQQPFNNDDAPTVPKGKWQFEFLESYDWLSKKLYPRKKQNTANFSLTYGVADRLEIGIAVPHIAIRSTGWDHGIGDTELNSKIQIIPHKEGRSTPEISISTKFEFPTGNPGNSLGSGFFDWQNVLIVEQHFLGVTHRLNSGVVFFGNTATGIEGILINTKVAIYGYSISREINKKLLLGSELTGSAASHVSFADAEMELLTGGMYKLSKNVELDFAYSKGLKRASPTQGIVFGFVIAQGSDVP